MLKHNLQMFAEETTEVEETAPVENEVKDELKPTEPEKKYTDDDVDEIVNKKFSKWQKEQEAKIEEAKKLEKMNAEDKAKYEKEQLESELAEYKRKEVRAGLTKEANKMLTEKGIQAPEEVVDVFVKDNAETTQESVKALISWVDNLHEQWEIKRNTGKTPDKVTNEQIDAFDAVIKNFK